MAPKKKHSKTTSQQSPMAEPKASAQLVTSTSLVPTLYYNKLKGSGNFSAWKEKFGIYVGSKYGRCQDLIVSGTKYVPAAIPVPDADSLSRQNDPHQIRLKCYQKSETSRLEQIIKMDEDYPRIFNDMLATFSRESEEMIKQHVDYDAADQAKCPGLLIAIVAITHQQPQSGAKEVDADTALARYFELKQGNKSLPQHKKDFDDAVDMLVASGEARPADDKLAIRFIASLDPNRFAQWKVDLENNVKAGLDVMPKTLPAAYSRAFNLKKVAERNNQVADASAFVAAGKHRGDNKAKGKSDKEKSGSYSDKKPSGDHNKGKGSGKQVCHLCKQPGHYVNACPIIKDDEVNKFIRDRMASQGSTRGGGVDAVHLGAEDGEGFSSSPDSNHYGTAGHVILTTIGNHLEDQHDCSLAENDHEAPSDAVATAGSNNEATTSDKREKELSYPNYKKT